MFSSGIPVEQNEGLAAMAAWRKTNDSTFNRLDSGVLHKIPVLQPYRVKGGKVQTIKSLSGFT
jgi:hypothetical protein